jgi:signal transduction histidine kinase
MNSNMKYSRLARLHRLLQAAGWHNHLLISLVFLLLFATFFLSIAHYWQTSLKPRLYHAAETQATMLAQSQTGILVDALEHSKPAQRHQKLYDAVQEMLIVEDSAINGRIVIGLKLEIDYDLLDAPEGSLNLSEGKKCAGCFHISTPLMNRNGDLFGVADIAINEGYFLVPSKEMKSKLFAESSLALGLLVVVWIAMLIMFQRLHNTKQAIEASDRAKTRFIASVTHELRTPLNAILGYTQLYKTDAELMASHGQGLATIDRSAEHLLLLINDILDFSRVDEANLSLHPREVNLTHFLNTLVEMAEIHARLKSIEFCCELPAQLPIAVLIDDKRLRQVLLNLLNNAIKFTEQGAVTFRVETLSKPNPKSLKLRFSVRDTGIGIAKEDLQTIFIPFHQLDNPITRAEGSGLGLTISQRLVNLMGARLTVESLEMRGSLFWFDLELPLLNNQLEEIAAPLTQKQQQEKQLLLPSTEILNALIELARQHNILGTRELVKELETSANYPEFVKHIQPYVRHYRFKPLVKWLEEVASRDAF